MNLLLMTEQKMANIDDKYRLTPKIKCPAKARVMRFDDKWILQHADDHHNCEPNRPKVTAELLRNKMKHLVRKDPAKAVGKAVRAVRIEAAKEFSEDEDFYQHLVAELGTDLQFYCKICKPTVANKDSSKEPSEIQPSCIQKIDNGFKSN